MALAAVALVVVGYVSVSDQRTRAKLTIESKRLAQAAKEDVQPPPAEKNGQPSRVIRIGQDSQGHDVIQVG